MSIDPDSDNIHLYRKWIGRTYIVQNVEKSIDGRSIVRIVDINRFNEGYVWEKDLMVIETKPLVNKFARIFLRKKKTL